MSSPLRLLFLGLGLAASLGARPVVPPLVGVTPDGDLSDWGERGLRVAIFTPDSAMPPDPARSLAVARLGWDAHGLLVAVDVIDTTPSEAHYASAAYLADSVELFLAPDPGKGEHLQLLLSPGHDLAHPAPRAYVFDNRPAEARGFPAEVAWAVKPRADGYVAEARLPWAALGLAPRAGDTVATRVFVNDHDGVGARTRFAWQPAPGAGRFFALTLGGAESGSGFIPDVLGRAAEVSGVKPDPRGAVAWLALDSGANGVRLNLVAEAELAGSSWSVSRGTEPLGSFTLERNGPVANGGLVLPPDQRSGGPAGTLLVSGPEGGTLETDDTRASLAAGAVARANGGWRIGPAEQTALAFARLEFAQHVFAGRSFPRAAFLDDARVARLLGASPEVKTRWLDAGGVEIGAPARAGLYAARTEITLPGRARPFVKEALFYRLPDGATVPSDSGEAAALRLGFSLMGADATPSHAARVAERWWHAVRRARGWAPALPYELHVPAGEGSGPRPLIVHLHGSGQARPEDAQRVLAELAALAGPEPIIAYPMSAEGWRGPAVGEMIDAITKVHAIDPARVYLIGFSMGGIGCWEVALDQPERFAAVAPIGGRMGSPADAARLRGTPVWVFNGAEDPTTTTEEAAIMVEALRRAGGEPRFTLLPGKAHGESQDAAYRHAGLFEWMLALRRHGGSGFTPGAAAAP